MLPFGNRERELDMMRAFLVIWAARRKLTWELARELPSARRA
jgi:hypothetical protein